MQQLLAKYIYKNYLELLKNDTLNLELSRLGWVKPAVVPKQTILFGNRIIRKYLTRTLKEFMNDFEFQRILCQVGYYGPACTTTSTTTTSTSSTPSPGSTTTTSTTSTTTTHTTTIIGTVNAIMIIDSSITNVTVNGVQPTGMVFPVNEGGVASGNCAPSLNATVVVSVTAGATPGAVAITDSNGTNFCQQLAGSGDYTFTGVVIQNAGIVILVDNIAC